LWQNIAQLEHITMRSVIQTMSRTLLCTKQVNYSDVLMVWLKGRSYNESLSFFVGLSRCFEILDWLLSIYWNTLSYGRRFEVHSKFMNFYGNVHWSSAFSYSIISVCCSYNDWLAVTDSSADDYVINKFVCGSSIYASNYIDKSIVGVKRSF
jgi:hypothetical protein